MNDHESLFSIVARLGVAFGTCASLMAIAGCDAPSSTTGTASTTTPKVDDRETIRKWTDVVLKLEDALAEGGQIAEHGGSLGPSGGYLGTIAKAYRGVMGDLSTGVIAQRIQEYEILNDTTLKTYEEFMEHIMKKGQPDAYRLPQLPYYQEYAYDAANKRLVVVEFPEKKKQFEEQNK
jgi:hypothetical protein